jgi:hypothetical protein
MIFQIFLLDVKGKVLIARNYRGEIDSNVIDKFMPILMEKGESNYRCVIINQFLTVSTFHRGGRFGDTNSSNARMHFRVCKN